MKRIAPSERMRKELQGVMNGGNRGGFLMSEIIRKGAELVLQEMLEQEATEFLGRKRYERSNGDGKGKGYRNGYEPRRIKTSEGEIRVEQPQLRDTSEPFRSRLCVFLRGNTEVLEKLAIEMYARGLSTRDIEDALIEATGDMIMSKSSVSKVTEVLWGEFEAFQKRDLSDLDVEYLFLDAIYETLRKRYGMKEAVLCAWGILRTGEKVIIHLGLGNKESYEDWLEFLRDMVSRGLRTPTSVTSDGAPGLIKAIEAVFPKSLRIRCWYHRMENFRNKVPEEIWPELKAEITMIRDASSYERGKQLTEEFISRYEGQYPSLIKALRDDLDGLLNHLKIPIHHRKKVRTTNLIERSFEEERRRTKVIPGFLTEKSGLKLVFATLIRASKRWQRVVFNPFDIITLDKIRTELGIDHETTGSLQTSSQVR